MGWALPPIIGLTDIWKTKSVHQALIPFDLKCNTKPNEEREVCGLFSHLQAQMNMAHNTPRFTDGPWPAFGWPWARSSLVYLFVRCPNLIEIKENQLNCNCIANKIVLFHFNQIKSNGFTIEFDLCVTHRMARVLCSFCFKWKSYKKFPFHHTSQLN